MASPRSAYCELEDVKRLLRATEQRVKFSDSYRSLLWNPNNDGNIRLTAFDVSPDYSGQQRFEITFSDSTNFTLIGDEIGYLGDGSRYSPFTSFHGWFTILPAYWTGVAQPDDKVSWEAMANISDTDALAFMRDAMWWTNGELREIYGDATNIDFFYDDVPIPYEVQLANHLKAACEIFNSVQVGAALDDESPVLRWCQEAAGLLENFVKDFKKVDGRPHWRARQPLITEFGVEGIEGGVIEGTQDDENYEA